MSQRTNYSWVLSATVLTILAVILPGWLDRAPVVHIWRNLTGWECRTCGVKRSISPLLHGQIVSAASMMPLGFVMAAGIGVAALRVRWIRCEGNQ